LKARSEAQELNNYEARGDAFRSVIAGLKAEFDALTERLTAAGWSPDKK